MATQIYNKRYATESQSYNNSVGLNKTVESGASFLWLLKSNSTSKPDFE